MVDIADKVTASSFNEYVDAGWQTDRNDAIKGRSRFSTVGAEASQSRRRVSSQIISQDRTEPADRTEAATDSESDPSEPRQPSAPNQAVLQSRLARWKKDTAVISSSTELVLHPDYQKIIGMGWEIVPSLLMELQREPSWLFWALVAITDEDPITDAERGNLAALAASWVAWGRERGIIGEKKGSYRATTGVGGKSFSSHEPADANV
jgi:hypothetical protein